MAYRQDYEYNHAVIGEAFQSLVRELRRRPTTAELATLTNLDPETVRRHLKRLKFKPSTHPSRILTDNVLLGLAHKAMKGDAAAAKLWLQVMEGWSERTEQTNNGPSDETHAMVRSTFGEPPPNPVD